MPDVVGRPFRGEPGLDGGVVKIRFVQLDQVDGTGDDSQRGGWTKARKEEGDEVGAVVGGGCFGVSTGDEEDGEQDGRQGGEDGEGELLVGHGTTNLVDDEITSLLLLDD